LIQEILLEGLPIAIDAPSLEHAMVMEDRNQVICTGGPEFAECVAAVFEKRRPTYAGNIVRGK
jgi:hypothetical protein